MVEPDDEDLLIAYVRRALELLEDGQRLDARALCADHPHLAAPVLEAVGLSEDVRTLHRSNGSADPRLGRRLAGRYRIDACLGRGAMGVVFTGTDVELGRAVAIKLFDSLGAASERAEQRFLREAELLAQVRHEHVVTVHDRGRDADGTLWLVMDLLGGASLAALMRRAESEPPGEDLAAWLREALGADVPPPPEPSWLRLVVHLAADVAAGLGAAHAQGVYHRDVKPSNILIRTDLRAVLLDFGIAARAGDPSLTAGETALGTPWYMAPEQATGDERTAATIDVYGLSATLYHLLTGKAPFDGDAAQVVARLQREDPLPPHVVRPDLPRDLAAIVEKGMAREPRHRYATIRELEADLRAFLAHRPVSARPLSRIARAVRRARRHPARTTAAAASLVAIVLALVVVPLWQWRAAREREAEHLALQSHLPKLLGFEGQPQQRLLVQRAELTASLATLDRMLELEPDDLATRLLRAALHLDLGDHAAAGRDLEELVERSGQSAYVRAVAERYARANRAQRGTESVDLDGLPEPVTDFDRFVAGFHELRNRHREGFAQRAEEHLTAVMQRYVPARDLRLVALLARGSEERDVEWFRRAHDESLVLEGLYGRPTARTLAVRGVALIMMKRYEDARDCLTRADALSPGRHSILNNLGVVWQRLGDLDQAMVYLKRAQEIRPWFTNTTVALVRVLRDMGRFEDALAVAEQLGGDRESDALRDELVARVHFQRALVRLPEEGLEAVRTDAERAVAAFDAALAATPSDRVRAGLERARAPALALLAADLPGAVRTLLAELRRTEPDARQIANLAALLPTELDPPTTAELQAYLRVLAIKMVPGDTAFRRRQEAAHAATMRRNAK